MIGAVAEGASLRLRLLLHRDAGCYDAFLRYRTDGGEVSEIHMEPTRELEEYRFYDAEIALSQGLYWYSFRYNSAHGEFFVVKSEGSIGVVSMEDGEWWQQTVYSADYTTPEWLRGGVIYQIFPDRFYSSGKPHGGVPEDRFLCSSWSRQPEYRQDGDKCSLGNDYYGGDLAGITEKLPYIASLGVTCIYMNPIFEAHSNHRYNTADYLKIDPLLGNEDDLRELCEKASELGISVILDGVFSHTGDDSVYFDRRGRYGGNGAYHSQNSPYHKWFQFENFPDKYKSWWGIETLPETNEEDPGFREFITGENGVLRRWLRCGIRGWRLDVADELPDSFLDRIRNAVKAEREDAYILGEVWEDATNKISYGARRRFLRGAQLDSVMNYPFAGAIIDFVRGGAAEKLNETVCSVLENYPKCAVHLLMNHIGTHDTARALTCLVKGYAPTGDREWMSRQVLSLEEYTYGVRLLKTAAVLQYTLPGVPSLYYGDEAGVQGYGDPFCRATYPWGQEDKALVDFYRALGKMRRGCDAFREGEFIPVYAEGGRIAYVRRSDKNSVLIVVNRSNESFTLRLPEGFAKCKTIFGERPVKGEITVSPLEFAVLSV